jgi:hypothetical protein
MPPLSTCGAATVRLILNLVELVGKLELQRKMQDDSIGKRTGQATRVCIIACGEASTGVDGSYLMGPS